MCQYVGQCQALARISQALARAYVQHPQPDPGGQLGYVGLDRHVQHVLVVALDEAPHDLDRHAVGQGVRQVQIGQRRHRTGAVVRDTGRW